MEPRDTSQLDAVAELVVALLNLYTETRHAFSISIGWTELRYDKTARRTVHRRITLSFASDVITVEALVARDELVSVGRAAKA